MDRRGRRPEMQVDEPDPAPKEIAKVVPRPDAAPASDALKEALAGQLAAIRAEDPPERLIGLAKELGDRLRRETQGED